MRPRTRPNSETPRPLGTSTRIPPYDHINRSRHKNGGTASTKGGDTTV